MLTETLILLLFGIIKVLLALIPNLVLTLPQEILGGIAGFVELLGGITFFFPVSTFIACSVWIFALYNFEFLMSVINWIIRKIPGLS